MSDHDYLRLRAITVSTGAALRSLVSQAHAPAVITRATELLTELEHEIRSNGADPELLRRISEARAELGTEYHTDPSDPGHRRQAPIADS